MEDLYANGGYARANPSWHAEDSAWKAARIAELCRDQGLRPGTVAEVGCGAGGVLAALAQLPPFEATRFSGYDVAPQAIALARRQAGERLSFHHADLLGAPAATHFELLLVIDVLEHVPDYLGFVAGCRRRAEHTLFHIPLDLHVSSVLRASFLEARRSVGHLHYFTAESALATLRDAGCEIVAMRYTAGAFGLFAQHPSWRAALANLPRWLVARFSVPLAARWFGGFSMLVLAK